MATAPPKADGHRATHRSASRPFGQCGALWNLHGQKSHGAARTTLKVSCCATGLAHVLLLRSACTENPARRSRAEARRRGESIPGGRTPRVPDCRDAEWRAPDSNRISENNREPRSRSTHEKKHPTSFARISREPHCPAASPLQDGESIRRTTSTRTSGARRTTGGLARCGPRAGRWSDDASFTEHGRAGTPPTVGPGRPRARVHRPQK